MKIEVYSDGSAQTAATPGGWGSVILLNGEFHQELSGHMQSATNNDAELLGAVSGLESVWNYLNAEQPFLQDYCVTLISDSEIVLNWANGKYRFKQLEKIAVYDRLRWLVDRMKVKTQWVKGHSGDKWNSRCDKLANDARKGIAEVLDKSSKIVDTRIGNKKKSVVSLWFQGVLKVIDFENSIIENYDREVHGKRGSIIEIREGKDR